MKYNAEKQHTIPVGTLVELETGVRLFVVHLGRERDMTPSYWLAVSASDDRGWYRWRGTFLEEALVPIVGKKETI